jgi:hypothetical protein
VRVTNGCNPSAGTSVQFETFAGSSKAGSNRFIDVRWRYHDNRTNTGTVSSLREERWSLYLHLRGNILWGHSATGREVSGSIPSEITGHPSFRLTQSLQPHCHSRLTELQATEMITRKLFGGKGSTVRRCPRYRWVPPSLGMGNIQKESSLTLAVFELRPLGRRSGS